MSAVEELLRIVRRGDAVFGTITITREEWPRLTPALLRAKVENAMASLHERAVDAWGGNSSTPWMMDTPLGRVAASHDPIASGWHASSAESEPQPFRGCYHQYGLCRGRHCGAGWNDLEVHK